MSGKQIDVGKNAASIQLLHLGFLHVFCLRHFAFCPEQSRAARAEFSHD